MNSADVHFFDAGFVDEATHRRDVAGEQQPRTRVGAVFRNRRNRRFRRVEVDVHLRRNTHAIQLLLPVARRDGVVDEHDELEIERLSPANDDLPVNEAIVDAVQLERHAPPPAVLPPAAEPPAPCAVIAALPRSAAWRAASDGVLPSANTKSSNVGRFVPAMSTASSTPRRIRRDAIVQLPAWRSVKITLTSASCIRVRSRFSMSSTLSF